MRRDRPSESLGDRLDGACRERVGAVVAGGAQAELDVAADFAGLERRQVEMLGDAFAQLAHVVGGQAFVEFGLGEEDDLQQLGGLRFEVGEQADFFQRLGRHGVRFVDHDDDPLAGRVTLDQCILQRADHRMRGLAVGRDAQFVGDGAEDFVARQRRVGQVERFDVGRQAFEQHAAEHGLAAADFAGDLDDAFVLGDGVDQRVERRAAVGAGKEEIGMRRDAKGRFAQAEVLEIKAHERCQLSMRL